MLVYQEGNPQKSLLVGGFNHSKNMSQKYEGRGFSKVPSFLVQHILDDQTPAAGQVPGQSTKGGSDV